MAYSQSKKLPVQEKKLLALKTQLYGKEKEEVYTTPAQKPAPHTNTLDTSYLKKDLQKIILLASLILGIQFLLWFTVQR